MFKSRTRILLENVAIAAVFLTAAVLGPHDALAKAKPKAITDPIPVIGKTADGKYPIYDLEGQLDDINWSHNHVIYSFNDLLPRLKRVKKEDVGHGYVCEYICMDNQKHIVGINPAW